MFVIIDENGVVVDIAARLQNLSRGYGYFGHTVFELGRFDITIGDTYKDGKFTPNMENRLQIIQRASDEAKITAWIAAWLRTLAIQDLKNKGELPAEYE